MGTRWNRLAEVVLTSTHNLCFEQKYEKNTRSENFQFKEVKFSLQLNRRVFVIDGLNLTILTCGWSHCGSTCICGLL